MSTAARRVTAIVIDDSAVVRKTLSDLLTAGGVDVIATAQDPLFAWPKMQARWPDVVVLDVEMPRMDGISFLRKLMAERPTPVVMCSTLTAAGAKTTLQALSEGAVSFVTKPTLGLRDFLSDPSNGLVAAVKAASGARVGPPRLKPATATMPAAAAAAPAAAPRTPTAPPPRPAMAAIGAMAETTDRIVAVGSSTGGVQAIETLLTGLPRTAPGIVIVQHMPEHFTAQFAARLDQLCAISVAEARTGDTVLRGHALLAPGNRHVVLKRSGARYFVEVVDGPLVCRHRPSVDVLFRSTARYAGANATGVLLTGMGDDGARGMTELHDAGARTIAQDEASCVVFGMPAEAIKRGGVDQVLPLDRIARALTEPR